MAETQAVAPGWGGGAETTTQIKPKNLGDLKRSKGIKVVVHGQEGVMKTGSGLCFPEPIDVLDLELGTEDLADHFIGKDIRVWTCLVMKEQVINGKTIFDIDKVDSLFACEHAFGEALKNTETKTIILDSVSELYDWAQEYMKREGIGLTKAQVMSSSIKKLTTRKDMSTFDFGISNSIMHDMIMKGLLTHKNFYLIAQDEQIWEDNKPTDKYKPVWMKKVPYWMPIIVNMTREPRNPDPKVKDGKYYATIEKCRSNPILVGEKIHLMTIANKKVKIEKTLYDWFVENGIGAK